MNTPPHPLAELLNHRLAKGSDQRGGGPNGTQNKDLFSVETVLGIVDYIGCAEGAAKAFSGLRYEELAVGALRMTLSVVWARVCCWDESEVSITQQK